MDDDFKTATEDQFYYELINRFFNPKSYFFNCIIDYLNRPISIIDNPKTLTLKILSEFIEFLTKSKKAVQDLQEISLIKGFEFIYSNLKNQIIRYDLRSLEPPQIKKAIQCIALFLLRDIYFILNSNEKSCDTLKLYIEIKSKLRDLLNGSDGKPTAEHLIHSAKQISPEFAYQADKKLSNELSTSRDETLASELNVDNIIDDSSKNSNNREIGSSFELNTSYHDVKSPSSRKPNTISIFSELLSEINESKVKHDDDILIPGEEDDEEVLKLIEEIDSGKGSLPLKDIAEPNDLKDLNSPILASGDGIKQEKHDQPDDDEKIEESIAEQENDSEYDKRDKIVFDEVINKRFQEESVLYYKILSSALSQLKNRERVQSALEDIELASSSLKQLAQKFGMEKLALLPELIESISMSSNKHKINLPTSIMQQIENAVDLLKKFDPNNADDRSSFMSIVMQLREFYMQTLHEVRKSSVTA